MRIYTKGAWKQEAIKNKRKEEKKKARNGDQQIYNIISTNINKHQQILTNTKKYQQRSTNINKY